jgi:hypothetical protein
VGLAPWASALGGSVPNLFHIINNINELKFSRRKGAVAPAFELGAPNQTNYEEQNYRTYGRVDDRRNESPANREPQSGKYHPG